MKSLLNKAIQLLVSRREYAITFGSFIIGQGLTFFASILVARFMGPIGRGEVTIAHWLSNTVGLLGAFGLPQALAFFTSRSSENDTRQFIALGFWIGLGLGVLETIILFPLVPWILGEHNQHLISATRVLLLYLPFQFILLLFLGIEQGKQTFIRYSIFRILPIFLYLAGIILLWIFDRLSVFNIAVVHTFTLMIVMITLIIINRNGLLIREGWSKSKRLLIQALVFFTPEVLSVILIQSDIFILLRLTTAEQIGYYNVAITLCLIINIVVITLEKVNFPKIAALQQNQNKAGSLLRQFHYGQIAILVMVIFLLVFSSIIIRILYGVEFSPSHTVVNVYLMAKALWGLTRILDISLRGLGQGAPGGLGNFVGLILLILFGYLLTDSLGVVGMAIAQVIAQAGAFGILIVFFIRETKVPLNRLWGITPSVVKNLFGI